MGGLPMAESPSFELDATRIRSWLQCPRKWYYKHALGLHTATGNPGHDLVFGQAIHGALEELDSKLACTDQDADSILCETLGKFWEATAAWDLDADLSSGAKCRESLVRVIVWYVEQFGGRSDPIRTARYQGEAMLEVPFRVSLADIQSMLGVPSRACGGVDSSQLFLVGRLDKVAFGLAEDDLWIVERKTTSRTMNDFYFARYQPEIQTSLYPIIGRFLFPEYTLQGVMLEAIQCGVSFCRFQRVELPRHVDQMRETLATIEHVFSDMIRTGCWSEPKLESQFLLNEAACMAGGSPCEFRRLCLDRPRNRPEAIAIYYTAREPWNPLAESRNDKVLTGPVRSLY